MQKAVGLLFLQSGILLRYVWKEGNVLKKVETTHFFMNQKEQEERVRFLSL